MAQISSPSSTYSSDQYQYQYEESQLQNRFLTEEEERELSISTNRQERRKIQNRVAQRAYRDKQKKRLQELEERLTRCHVSARQYGSLQNTAEARVYGDPDSPQTWGADLDSPQTWGGDLDSSQTWASLATSYPIATSLQSRVSGSPSTPASSGSSQSHQYQEFSCQGNFQAPDSRERRSNRRRPVYAIGYIESAAVDIPADVTPFFTLSLMPVRIAIQMNLEILGMRVEQYRSDDSISSFLTGMFRAISDHPVPAHRIISDLQNRAPDLVPSRLQFEIRHHPYLDVIPFPALRDRVLEELFNDRETLDEEELCYDIEHGLRIWGKVPWDRRCWEFTAGFVAKWNWLLDEESIGSTNFWRAQRGEALLNFGGSR